MTQSQALKQARDDGLTEVSPLPDPASYRCDRGEAELGPTKPTAGQYAHFRRPRYSIAFGDHRVPPTGDTENIGMLVVVFDSPALAAQCARAEIAGVKVVTTGGYPVPRPFTVISDNTIGLDMHADGARGTLPGTTGDYQTFLEKTLTHVRALGQIN